MPPDLWGKRASGSKLQVFPPKTTTKARSGWKCPRNCRGRVRLFQTHHKYRERRRTLPEIWIVEISLRGSIHNILLLVVPGNLQPTQLFIFAFHCQSVCASSQGKQNREIPRAPRGRFEVVSLFIPEGLVSPTIHHSVFKRKVVLIIKIVALLLGSPHCHCCKMGCNASTNTK